VNPLLSPDRPTESAPEPAPPSASPLSGSEAHAPSLTAETPSPARSCVNCGAPLQDAQGWCLQCGAGAPGNLSDGSTWRPLAIVALATAALVAGAAVAGAAALNKHKTAPRVAVTTVAAQTPAPAPAVTPSTPAPTTTPGLATPTTPGTGVAKVPGEGSAANKSLFPTGNTKPPKIPLTTPTPKSSTGTGITPKGSNSETPTTTTGTTPGEGAAKSQPTPILLDTNAASVYNPYGYPEVDFGDPSLAVDGDTTTAWTARLVPSVAPRMAEGLLIDLKTGHHVGRVEVHTSTPGVTVEAYGTKGDTTPASITDPAWTQLNPSHALKKKTVLKLRDTTKQFRYVLLWLTKAPAASVGTPEAPGQVSINELSLFAPAAS
jgi:hypothetical protein